MIARGSGGHFTGSLKCPVCFHPLWARGYTLRKSWGGGAENLTPFRMGNLECPEPYCGA